MRIQHNIMAMNAYRNYNNNTSALSSNLEKLSSGYKINRAGDDAAGLAISEKMRAQISGLDQAQSNVKDGISLVKTGEGALQEVQDMMNRMVTLATQSANGTYDDETDRANLQKEVEALQTEIDRIADSANFNGINLLDGSLGGGSISATGATFTGAEVAKYQNAQATLALADMTGASKAIDTFTIDGQTLTIDWTKGDAAKLAASLTATDLSSATTVATKDWATKIADLFNSEMKTQGLSGSVKAVNVSAAAFKLESENDGYDSEVTYAGSKAGDPSKALGAYLFKTDTTNGNSSINKATQLYNGDNLKATDYFTMTINGTDVKVSVGAAYTKGASGSKMSTVATQLQTQIRAAVALYNTENGLTAGSKNSTSGLTGLTANDFTVEVVDGSFQIKYSGDVDDVTFSFSDVGERTTAQSLGLANGSSQAGGNRGLNLQIGDTSDSYNQMVVSIQDMHVRTLGISGVDISTQSGAAAAIDKIKSAINQVSSVRGDLGAIQNRLEHTQNNLSVMSENITDAESTIRDTDVAEEMMSYTKNNILIQSAQAMLAQANSVPQGVLQLLQ